MANEGGCSKQPKVCYLTLCDIVDMVRGKTDNVDHGEETPSTF